MLNGAGVKTLLLRLYLGPDELTCFWWGIRIFFIGTTSRVSTLPIKSKKMDQSGLRIYVHPRYAEKPPCQRVFSLAVGPVIYLL